MEYTVGYATSIVKDMDESIEYYKRMFGFKMHSQYNPAPGLIITLMKGPGDTMIELIKNDQFEPGFYSVGMVVDDACAAVKELKEKGAKIIGEPAPTLVGKCGFVEDLNGVRIALIEHDERFQD